MGGVPVKHHSKGKVGRRRSHLALKQSNISVCQQCKGPIRPHRTCPQCGFLNKKHSKKVAPQPAVKKSAKKTSKSSG